MGKHRIRKLVTIVLEYDPQECDHPSQWDWPTLLDFSTENIKRVEVFSAGTQTEIETAKDS